MAKKVKKLPGKTLWRDIGDLRKPNPAWKLGRAARWWAKKLGLPPKAVVFRNPDKTIARTDKTLKSLLKDYRDKT